jgi:hypothetical protein
MRRASSGRLVRSRFGFASAAAVIVALAFSELVGAVPASAAQLRLETVAAAVTARSACVENANTAACDSDNDRIADVIETAVCGTATCATGREDTDKDGIADWVEIQACDTKTCASATKDTDRDGVPDYAETLVCGSAVCSGGREDADGDGIADWVEFVICGTRACANGSEDYNGDGISDAKQLAACVIKFGVTGPASLLAPPPVTITIVSENPTVARPGEKVSPPLSVRTDESGQVRIQIAWWPLIVGLVMVALAGLSFGWVWWSARRRRRDNDDSSAVDASAPDHAAFRNADALSIFDTDHSN